MKLFKAILDPRNARIDYRTDIPWGTYPDGQRSIKLTYLYNHKNKGLILTPTYFY